MYIINDRFWRLTVIIIAVICIICLLDITDQRLFLYNELGIEVTNKTLSIFSGSLLIVCSVILLITKPKSPN